MKTIIAAIAALSLLSIPSAYAAPNFGKQIAKHGNWTVHRRTDPMTDAPDCVAIYRNRSDVQMVRGHLYLDMTGKGGISGYQVRFDDTPAQQLQVATDREKATHTADIDQPHNICASKRLRVRMLTLLNKVVEEDINLTGISEAYDVLTGPQCSLEPY